MIFIQICHVINDNIKLIPQRNERGTCFFMKNKPRKKNTIIK